MFMIFSVLSSSVKQMREQFALLRSIGLSQKMLFILVLSIGAFLSIIGSFIGLLIGLILTTALISFLNGDLGANLVFQSVSSLKFDWVLLLNFVVLGIIVGIISSILPAIRTAKVLPSEIFKIWEQKNNYFVFSPIIFFLLILLSIFLLYLPPYKDIYVFSYLSIGVILLSFIFSIPKFSEFFTRLVLSKKNPLCKRKIWSWLAIYRLKNNLEETGHIVSPVVASFALTISIVIMVTSFKSSVVSWLDKLLIADIYGSIKQDQGFTNMDKKLREKISNIDGVRKIEFSK